MPMRSLMLGCLLSGLAVLSWRVSGSERQVVCSLPNGPAGLCTCIETESGPNVPGGRRVTEHILLTSEELVVTQLSSARGTSMLWSLVVLPKRRSPAKRVDRSDPSLTIASGGSKAWAEGQRARLEALRRAPAGESVVFEDAWRGPIMRWTMRLLALGGIALGCFEMRKRAREAPKRAVLIWLAGAVGGLVGVIGVGVLLG